MPVDEVWKADRRIDEAPKLTARVATEAWGILIQRLKLSEQVANPLSVRECLYPPCVLSRSSGFRRQPLIEGLAARAQFDAVPLSATKRILQLWWM